MAGLQLGSEDDTPIGSPIEDTSATGSAVRVGLQLKPGFLSQQAKPVAGGFRPGFLTTPKPGVAAPSEKGDFSRGVSVAVGQAKQAMSGVKALAADTVGMTSTRDAALKYYQAQGEVIAKDQKPTDSFSNVWDNGDLGDAIDFLQYGAGYVTAQAGMAIASSIGGAGVGGIASIFGKGAIKQGVEAYAKKVLKDKIAKDGIEAATKAGFRELGAGAALTAFNLSQELGHIYPDAVEEAALKGEDVGLLRVYASGVLAAGLETLADTMNIKGLGKAVSGVKGANPSMLRRVATEAFISGLREGGTELAQTGVERWGASKALTGPDAMRDYVDSTALGIVGGGAVGSLKGAITRPEKTPPPADAAATDVPPDTPDGTPPSVLGNNILVTPELKDKFKEDLAARGLDPDSPEGEQAVKAWEAVERATGVVRTRFAEEERAARQKEIEDAFGNSATSGVGVGVAESGTLLPRSAVTPNEADRTVTVNEPDATVPLPPVPWANDQRSTAAVSGEDIVARQEGWEALPAFEVPEGSKISNRIVTPNPNGGSTVRNYFTSAGHAQDLVKFLTTTYDGVQARVRTAKRSNTAGGGTYYFVELRPEPGFQWPMQPRQKLPAPDPTAPGQNPPAIAPPLQRLAGPAVAPTDTNVAPTETTDAPPVQPEASAPAAPAQPESPPQQDSQPAEASPPVAAAPARPSRSAGKPTGLWKGTVFEQGIQKLIDELNAAGLEGDAKQVDIASSIDAEKGQLTSHKVKLRATAARKKIKAKAEGGETTTAAAPKPAEKPAAKPAPKTGQEAEDEATVALTRDRLRKRSGLDSYLLDVAPEPADKGAKLAAEIARSVFGQRVIWVKQGDKRLLNGVTAVTGEILLDVDSTRPHLAVMGHELLHTMRRQNKELYDQFIRDLVKHARDLSSHRAELDKAYKEAGLKTLSDEKFLEEFGADVVGDFFTDPKFWQGLQKRDQSLFQQLADFVLSFLDNLYNSLQQIEQLRPFGTDQLVSNVADVRKLVVQAVGDYAKSHRNNAGSANDSLSVATATKAVEDLFGETIRPSRVAMAMNWIIKSPAEARRVLKLPMDAKRVTKRQFGDALDKWRAGKISPTDFSVAARNKLARALAEEVAWYASYAKDTGIDWYSKKFPRAIDALAERIPSLKTREGRGLFTALLAITSDGTEVQDNLNIAVKAYLGFMDGKTLADSVSTEGKYGEVYLRNAQILDMMIAELGQAGAIEVMLEPILVSDAIQELKFLGLKDDVGTKYPADATVPRAAIFFGPKLGAFYANLMGSRGYLTMDRWWTRTINRYRGYLTPSPTPQSLQEFRDLTGAQELSEEKLIDLAESIYRERDRRIKQNKDYASSKLETVATTIYKNARSELRDSPTGPADRRFNIEVVREAQRMLRERGIDAEIADIQATIWYYEKRLFEAIGVRGPARISYEEAAREWVRLNGRPGARGVQQDERGGAPAAGQEAGVQEDLFSIARPDAAGDRRTGGVAPEEREGRVDLVGTHFSREPRTFLDGRMYGTGLRGAEAERLSRATDPRLRERVYFYVDEGKGLRPESGVGGYAHRVEANNIYNLGSDPLKLGRADSNAMESLILDAGFSGYYVPRVFNNQGVGVIMGPASHYIQVQRLPQGQRSAGANATAAAPQAPAWKTWATGDERRLQAMAEAMRTKPSWANYDIRVRDGKVEVRELATDDLSVAPSGEVTARGGVNTPRVTQIMGQNLYGDMSEFPQVALKEMMQNGFDAIKGLMTKKKGHAGEMAIALDEKTRQISVFDNGTGMTPEILSGPFLEVAGTKKDTENSAGGFGIAKLQFLYGADALEVYTLRNGVLSVMKTDGQALHNSMSADGDPVKIQTYKGQDAKQLFREEVQKTYAIIGYEGARHFRDTYGQEAPESGTVVRIAVPASFYDRNAQETKPVPFGTSSYDYPAVKNSPLFANIKVVAGGGYAWEHEAGSDFPIDDYDRLFDVKFDWGTATTYVTREENGDKWGNNVHYLSNGLWQFSAAMKKNPNEMFGDNVPRQFFVDIRPKAKAGEAGYPFELNRQGFTKMAEKDFAAVRNYLNMLYQRDSLQESTKELTNVSYIDSTGKLEPIQGLNGIKFETGLVGSISPKDKVVVVDGRLEINGKVVPVLTKEDMQKAKIEAENYKAPEGTVDPSRPIVHDNLELPADILDNQPENPDADARKARKESATYKSLSQIARERFGDRFDRMNAEFSDAFMQLKNVVIDNYDGETGAEKWVEFLKKSAIGVSYDLNYRGVSTVVPFKSKMLNPIATVRTDPMRGAAGLYTTLVHEFAHAKVRDHGVAFEAQMQLLWGDLEFDADAAKVKRRLRDIFERHQDIITTLNGAFFYGIRNQLARPAGRSLQTENDFKSTEAVSGGDGRGAGDDAGAGPGGEGATRVDRADQAGAGSAEAVQDDGRVLDDDALSIDRVIDRPGWDERTRAALNEPFNGPARKTITERLDGLRKDFLRRFTAAVVDPFIGLKEISQELYMRARLTNGTDGGLEALLHYGQVFDDGGALNVKKGTKGLLSALAPLGGEVEDFLRWVALNRASELKKQDRENFFTEASIALRGKLIEGTMPDGRNRSQVYRQALSDMNALNRSVLSLALKQGLIDQAGFDRFSKDIWYVPFYRVVEENDSEVAGYAAASGLSGQDFGERLKGGKDRVDDLLTNLLRNWGGLLSASQKNAVARDSLLQAVQLGGAKQVKSGTKDAIRVMVDGREKSFLVQDPLLADALMAINTTQMNNPAIRALGWFKRALTGAVTIDPAFKIRNLIRDSIQAISLADLPFNPVANVVRGMRASNDENRVSALAGGGLFHGHFFGEEDLAKKLRRLAQHDPAAKVITDPISLYKVISEGYNRVGDRMENANRVALYDAIIAKGGTHLEAAYAARDLMDFSLQGRSVAIRTLAATLPFFNARLQGLYKLGRDGLVPTIATLMGKADEGQRKQAARFGAVLGAVTMAGLLLYLLYKDDEDFQKRERWDRDNFWWFKVNGLAIRIPKPFEVGALATIAERGLEQLIDENAGGAEFAKSMTDMLVNTFAFDPIPQAFRPLLNLSSNVDSFTGRPIESLGMQQLSKTERWTAGTTETAKILSQANAAVAGALGPAGKDKVLSPAQIDYLARGYFGWLGASVMQFASAVVKTTDDISSPSMRVDDIWVLGSFVKETPSTQSRYVNDFYQSAVEIDRKWQDIKFYQRLGQMDTARELALENQDALALRGIYAAAQRQIAAINREMRRVEVSGTMGSEEKRRVLDDLALRKSEIASRVEATKRTAQAS